MVLIWTHRNLILKLFCETKKKWGLTHLFNIDNRCFFDRGFFLIFVVYTCKQSPLIGQYTMHVYMFMYCKMLLMLIIIMTRLERSLDTASVIREKEHWISVISNVVKLCIVESWHVCMRTHTHTHRVILMHKLLWSTSFTVFSNTNIQYLICLDVSVQWGIKRCSLRDWSR